MKNKSIPMNLSKNKIAKKIIMTVFSLMFFCFIGTPKSQAAWIPGLDPAITEGLMMIDEMIDGLMVGTLKQQAVMMLSIQVDSLAGRGSGGQATFIVNWQNFLIDEPQNETNLYMNDYISQMTRGRNSSSLYSTEGFSGPANYGAQLGQVASVLGGAKQQRLTYEGDPSQMLQSGNFKNMELYLSGVNNPWGFNIAVQSEQQRVLENRRTLAMARSQAGGGYLGVPGSSPGTESMPGSTVGAMMNSKQTMPDRILEAASSIPEVATALVTQMISRSVMQGFVSVRSKTAKATAGVTKYTSATNQAMNTYGPAARFGVDAAKSGQQTANDILLPSL
ncbi:MAG: hypothetical protein WC678_02285 [Parcubacteria group bacterium]